MKKSELKIIGDYRMSPDAWGGSCGESMVMVDEAQATAEMAKCFGCSEDACDPDGYENDTPKCVELAVDGKNNYYVVFSGKSDGLFQSCEDIMEAGTSGMLATLGRCKSFEDEED